ncbi:MAG: TIGR00267 family protein [Methanobacteriaceae archaeon]
MNIKNFIQEYLKMSRYLALGTMDGILAVMGFTLTASGVASIGAMDTSNLLIALTGLSGGVAISMSNAFGSYIGEKAEEKRSLRELERKMLLKEGKLDNTIISKEAKKRIYMGTFAHGFSSFIGAFIPVLPFFLLEGRIEAIVVTIVACFISLIFLGFYLARVSRESLTKTSIEIVAIGIFITIVSFLLGGI